MKNIIFFWLLLVFSNFITAQNTEEKFLLTTNTNNYGVSSLQLLDPYLSPLVYNGLGIRYDHEVSRYLSINNNSLSRKQNLSYVGGLALNPSGSASMMYAAFNYDFAIFHHFTSINGLKLMAGGSWDVDFGYKMISRNINNPVNIDLATNLNFSGVAKYDIRLFKRNLGLQLTVQSPMIGCMFVPRGGASYYEMFDLHNLDNTLHFSTLHNKQGINGTISCIIPLKTITLNLGVKYQGLKYAANDMVFKRNEFSFLIGTRFDVIKFSGRNKKAPSNFISINQ